VASQPHGQRGQWGRGLPVAPYLWWTGSCGRAPFTPFCKKIPPPLPPHSLEFLLIPFSSSFHHMHFYLSARSTRCEALQQATITLPMSCLQEKHIHLQKFRPLRIPHNLILSTHLKTLDYQNKLHCAPPITICKESSNVIMGMFPT
jgi:hypothetical protein